MFETNLDKHFSSPLVQHDINLNLSFQILLINFHFNFVLF